MRRPSRPSPEWVEAPRESLSSAFGDGLVASPLAVEVASNRRPSRSATGGCCSIAARLEGCYRGVRKALVHDVPQLVKSMLVWTVTERAT